MIDPETLKFTASHEWVHHEGGLVTIGISKFAVDQLTDLIVIDLPPVGKKLTAGKSFGEIESVKAVSDIYAPVGGEVVEVNSAVVADVQVLGQDPYNAGWLIKVRPDGTESELMDCATYTAKVAHDEH
jgi:glycine cleavage system H protein